MRNILVLHGPNLNLLGSREPSIYGHVTLEQLNDTLITNALDKQVAVVCKQTNSEPELIDYVQQAQANQFSYLIINAAAFAHTSLALRDALLAARLPFIEVHISNVYAREQFRAFSYLSDIADGVIVGLGTIGYELALNAAINFLNNKIE